MDGTPHIDTSAFAARLRREIKGDVLFSRADRGRYATDASIYQVEPVGVIVPERTEDVAAAMAIAREDGVAGAGARRRHQPVRPDRQPRPGDRLHASTCAASWRRPGARTALVEPGIVLGHLNAALKPHGLFFPVDPSTHARCTIGGMAGNNSCGSKSIRYGLMADNVTAIDAILADGTRHRFGACRTTSDADMPAGMAT